MSAGRNPRHQHVGAMPRSSFVAPPFIKEFFYRYSGLARSVSVGIGTALYRYLQITPAARTLMGEIMADTSFPVPRELEGLCNGAEGDYAAILDMEERGEARSRGIKTGRRGRSPLYSVKMEPGDIVATPGEMEFLRRLGGAGKGALSRGVRLLFQELTDKDDDAREILHRKNGHSHK